MDTEQELIDRLSILTGQKLLFDGDTCDLVVADRAVLLKYRSEEHAWFAIAVVGQLKPAGDPLRTEVLEAALSANFLGRYTRGLQLGLFGDDLMVFDRLAADGLTAETLAERLILLSTHTTKMVEDWRAYREQLESEDSAEPPADNIWNFLRA